METELVILNKDELKILGTKTKFPVHQIRIYIDGKDILETLVIKELKIVGVE